MANTNGWPPQAYTKETLAEAYEWLKTQPDSVKVLAKDSATLVSLYTNHQLRAQDGFAGYYDQTEAEETLKQSAPVSGERFKSELKTLAQGLNEFVPAGENISTSASTQNFEIDTLTNQRRNLSESTGTHGRSPQQQLRPQSPQMTTQQQQMSSQNFQVPHQTLPPHVNWQGLENAHSRQGQPSSGSASMRAQGPAQQSSSSQGSSISGLAALLDANSQLRVAHVRKSLNLSSDNEALRMLISLGFDRLKNILPVD